MENLKKNRSYIFYVQIVQKKTEYNYTCTH